MYMWDPCGTYISSTRADAPAEATAKQYRHVGSDLPTRFADQFSPWSFAPVDVTRYCEGLMIRLALRDTALPGGVSQVRCTTLWLSMHHHCNTSGVRWQ